MNQYRIPCALNVNPHLPEAGNGGKAVRPFKETGDFRRALCQGTEHNAAVGDGFISWYGNFPFQAGGFRKFHGNSFRWVLG